MPDQVKLTVELRAYILNECKFKTEFIERVE
jgi:hypothetical protein